MAIRYSSSSGVPFGTSSDRPSSPQIGQTFYNGTLGVQEIYTSSGWLPATGANDFNVTLNGTVTTATFTKEYFAGAYTIASALLDSSYDIYVYDTSGNQVGYTKSPSLNATGNFNKIVVIGGTNSDLLSFSYKTTFTANSTSNQVTAGPFITSLSPSTLANINDTTTVTGGNFASDVQAVFIGSDNVERSPKSLVRNSVTSLTLTRPDTLPQAYEPYSVKVTNPGITSPTGSNLHILSNAVDAGSSPVWSTAGALTAFIKGNSYSYSLSASDADSSITYAIASGSLPTGLSLNTSNGVISGTPTVNTGTPYTFTVSATDLGGNTTSSASLTLSQNVPDSPTIGTVVGGGSAAASVPFTAPSYTGTSGITSYTAVAYISGVSAGITGTINQSGSGTITVTGLTAGTTYTFKVYATNQYGNSVLSSQSNSFTASAIPITNGLIFWLDASDPTSYSGTGSTWYDMSGNSRNFSQYGSTSYGSNGTASYFTNFSNSGSWKGQSGWLPQGADARTIISFVRTPSTLGSYKHIFHYGNQTQGQAFGIALQGATPETHTWSSSYNPGVSVSSSTNYMISTGVTNSNTQHVWINTSSYTGAGSNSVNTGDSYVPQIGSRIDTAATEGFTDGRVYLIAAYNRKLSDAEITTIYNTYKTRFSLP